MVHHARRALLSWCSDLHHLWILLRQQDNTLFQIHNAAKTKTLDTFLLLHCVFLKLFGRQIFLYVRL